MSDGVAVDLALNDSDTRACNASKTSSVSGSLATSSCACAQESGSISGGERHGTVNYSVSSIENDGGTIKSKLHSSLSFGLLIVPDKHLAASIGLFNHASKTALKQGSSFVSGRPRFSNIAFDVVPSLGVHFSKGISSLFVFPR